ncbi:Uncharacterised protein [Mannheimia haemolytica]|uniref:Uncharacterized protein n=1 Tax=Mannheimia haemolytica TaxID=75985 RepID=A0A378NEU0_MANHA|nr:Uncharacterised protein [Mannheimia haemolytica]
MSNKKIGLISLTALVLSSMIGSGFSAYRKIWQPLPEQKPLPLAG